MIFCTRLVDIHYKYTQNLKLVAQKDAELAADVVGYLRPLSIHPHLRASTLPFRCKVGAFLRFYAFCDVNAIALYCAHAACACFYFQVRRLLARTLVGFRC